MPTGFFTGADRRCTVSRSYDVSGDPVTPPLTVAGTEPQKYKRGRKNFIESISMKDIQNLYYIMGFNEADEEVGVWLESLLFVFAAATDIDA